MLTSWLPLMEIPVRLGGLAVQPGGHHWPPQPPRPLGGSEPGWATTGYQPGDVLIFHCLTPHAALPNTGPELPVSGNFRWQAPGPSWPSGRRALPASSPSTPAGRHGIPRPRPSTSTRPHVSQISATTSASTTDREIQGKEDRRPVSVTAPASPSVTRRVPVRGRASAPQHGTRGHRRPEPPFAVRMSWSAACTMAQIGESGTTSPAAITFPAWRRNASLNASVRDRVATGTADEGIPAPSTWPPLAIQARSPCHARPVTSGAQFFRSRP